MAESLDRTLADQPRLPDVCHLGAAVTGQAHFRGSLGEVPRAPWGTEGSLGEDEGALGSLRLPLRPPSLKDRLLVGP